jgi:hypothetical protein
MYILNYMDYILKCSHTFSSINIINGILLKSGVINSYLNTNNLNAFLSHNTSGLVDEFY